MQWPGFQQAGSSLSGSYIFIRNLNLFRVLIPTPVASRRGNIAVCNRSQFEKTSLVAKLKAARDRKKAATGKCGGRKTYAEARPDVVLLAKQMHDQGMSLRKISAELAARGYVTAGGKPYVASAVQTMLG
jgi:hypothetical protein